MIIEVDQEVPEFTSYSAVRTRGLFNVGAEDGRRFRLTADVPLEGEEWRVGVVVGPSGSGKSSVLRKLVEEEGWHEWSDLDMFGSLRAPIIDVLSGDTNPATEAHGLHDAKLTYAKATAALTACGLGSVPSWLRPYDVLSTGEKFRAGLAGMLLSVEPRVVVDEFTSVLDRQVAKIGAGAFAKAWKKQKGRQVVLFTCHYDVLGWLEPDWIVDTGGSTDQLGGGHAGPVAEVETDLEKYAGDQVQVGTLEIKPRKATTYKPVAA